MALRWITYPTQVIAKSSKPIPVMLIGVLLANKRYRLQKYFFVLMIVVGVIMFIYKEGKAKARTLKIFFIVSLLNKVYSHYSHHTQGRRCQQPHRFNIDWNKFIVRWSIGSN